MNKQKKNILVTGGCGFIGSNFVKELLNYNYNVIIIDNLSSGHKKNLDILKIKAKKNKSKIFFFKKNLLNYTVTEKIFKKFRLDFIYHFAAFSNVEESIKFPKKVINNNVKTTSNLIKLIKKYKIKYFIFSSSASVYGNVVFNKNIKENVKLIPINPYGVSKQKCEKLIISKSKKLDFQYCIFRYFNVVGKHVAKNIEKKSNLSLFEKISYCLKKNKVFKIHGEKLNTGDGTPVRDFIHMEDIISAHLRCIKLKDKKQLWNNAFNIGYKKGVSVLQIISEYNKIFKKKIKYEFTLKKKGVIERSVANNEKFIKLSNWKPKYSKIEKIIKSYFSN